MSPVDQVSSDPNVDPDPNTNPGAAPEQPSERGLSLWQMIGSALAAGLGVQSSRNRKRDFNQGKATHFIAIGIIFTVLFVVGMVFLVRFVLSLAASG